MYVYVCRPRAQSSKNENSFFIIFSFFLLRDFFLLLIRMTILNLSFKSEKNITANGNWGERGADFYFYFFVFLMINYDKFMFS